MRATVVTVSDSPSRHLLMLHGIYGRGRNWQGIARALAEARPEYACWLVDLPHHGDSGPGAHGDTVHGAAADLDDWLRGEDIQPDAVLGHSYGGKVALAFAARRGDHPLQVWVVDSTPATSEPSGSAWRMLEVVRALPPRLAGREEAAAGIVAAGFSPGVAQWMTTNLVRDGDGFVWRLDLDAMERLLRDFFATGLWKGIEHPASAHEIHILKASESSIISPAAVSRILAVPQGRVHLHERQGGHWIHAESPDVVTGLLVEHLPR